MMYPEREHSNDRINSRYSGISVCPMFGTVSTAAPPAEVAVSGLNPRDGGDDRYVSEVRGKRLRVERSVRTGCRCRLRRTGRCRSGFPEIVRTVGNGQRVIGFVGRDVRWGWLDSIRWNRRRRFQVLQRSLRLPRCPGSRRTGRSRSRRRSPCAQRGEHVLHTSMNPRLHRAHLVTCESRIERDERV